MIKILYDYQTFLEQDFGGISRYFQELFININSIGENVHCDLPIKYSNNYYLKKIPSLAEDILRVPDFYKEFLPGINFKGKGKLFKLKNTFYPLPNIKEENQKLIINKLSKGELDVFHPTYYDDYFLPFLGSKPFVLTVHDMVHELYPEFFLDEKLSVKKRRLIEKANHIIAVSENTKKDLINLFQINENKITVVYHGNSIGKENIITSSPVLPEKYILYVGNRGLYKNFYFFIRAIQPLLEQDRNMHVVCTAPTFSREELNFFDTLGVRNQLINRYVNDISLASIYSNAKAFVFPSLYEGFGIPVLEAFTVGCPTLLSNSSSLPEIGGDAAIYFEPKDALSIKNSLRNILENNHLRAELVLKGFERVKNFSLQKMTIETIDVYKKVLSI